MKSHKLDNVQDVVQDWSQSSGSNEKTKTVSYMIAPNLKL